jgi:hypothetical protein
LLKILSAFFREAEVEDPRASRERWMDCLPMVISVFGSSRAATFAYVTARSLPVVGARVSPSDWVIVTEPSPYTVSQCGAFQNQPGPPGTGRVQAGR